MHGLEMTILQGMPNVKSGQESERVAICLRIDIRVHIAVEITDSACIQRRRADSKSARVHMNHAAHVPDHNLSGCGIFPKDVG